MMLGEPFKYSIASDKEVLNNVIDTALMATGKPIYIQILSDEDVKSNKQNATFHKLLRIFHETGMHSFISYKSLRNNYLSIAGLSDGYSWRVGIESDYADNWEDVPKEYRKYASPQYKSWSKVTKSNAKKVLSILIDDMKEAGVNNKDFEDMLDKWINDKLEFYGFV